METGVPHKCQVVEEQGKKGRGGELRGDSTGLALYNTRNDAGERYDVKDDNPEVVEELEEVAEKAREDLGDGLQNKKGKNRRKAGFDENAKGDKRGN